MVRYLTLDRFDYDTPPETDGRDPVTLVDDAVAHVLARAECRLAGLPTVPDRWHGRMVTTDADFARFTEVDLDEATSRLTRLAACYRSRLSTIDAALLDATPDDGGWTLRQVVHHVSRVTGYADMLDPPALAGIRTG